jgi:hypothetical protein
MASRAMAEALTYPFSTGLQQKTLFMTGPTSKNFHLKE